MATWNGGARPADDRPGTASSVDRFVLVPADLVALVSDKKIGKEAAWLYVVLLSHHNRTRGDNDVWPSRKLLSEEMGFSEKSGPKAVDKYLAELRNAGLIISQRRSSPWDNGNTSSLHTLTLIVPDKPQEPDPPIPHRGQGLSTTGDRGWASAGDRPSTPQGTRTRRSELDEPELDEMNNILAPRASRGSPDDETEVVEAEIISNDDYWSR